jgi:cell division protein FtsB
MNTADQILVIVLAAVLAIFLLLSVIIAVQVIRILRILRDIAVKAQEFADSAETAAELFKSTVGRLTVLRFAHSVIEFASKHRSKK